MHGGANSGVGCIHFLGGAILCALGGGVGEVGLGRKLVRKC